ncbi:hypothetical protein ACFQ9X_54710 [Catenulispora yoronensis]
MLKKSVSDAITFLSGEVNKLKSIENGHGGPLIEQTGWPEQATRDMRSVLEDLRDDFVAWARIAKRRTAPLTFALDDDNEMGDTSPDDVPDDDSI